MPIFKTFLHSMALLFYSPRILIPNNWTILTFPSWIEWKSFWPHCGALLTKFIDFGTLFPKNVLTYCEKSLFQWSRKTFEIRDSGLRICKKFEITWTIYSNSERSEQFLVTECFFNLFLEISQISKNRAIRIQIGKNYWDLGTCRKS